jgi:hypothetical protein
MGISLSLRRALFSAALAAPVLVVACGARGPLDIEVIKEFPEGSVPLDAVADVPGETSDVAANDVLADVIDAAPEAMGPDGGPLVNCGSCIAQNCGQQLITCLTSTGCRTALQCVVQMCLTGGMPSLQCLGGCTGSDPMTQQQVLTVLGCIVGTCGSQCAGALGGLGGGGGGGGGGSGGGAGG